MEYNFDSDSFQQRDSNKMLALIFGYFEQISVEREIDKVLSLLADMGRDIVEAERCTLWLLDEKNNTIFTKIAHGVDKLSVNFGEGLVGYAIETGREAISNDPYNDPRFSRKKDDETGFVTREILVIPIKNSTNKITGAFQAVNKVTGNKRFTKEDLHHLRLVASYSGNSIETAQLNEEIEATQKEVITLLGQACEMRSFETGNHIKRVAAYTKILGEAMDLSENDVKLLTLASPLHDIGKIGVPDAILLKPGKLTPSEYEIIKTHSDIGYNILKGSSRNIISAAAIIAHQHHERYDGKGYPQGIAGENIHIFARITAICDVFDALMSKRVYKKAWSAKEVLELFKNEKGRQFDPRLVDLLLLNSSEFMEIHDNFIDTE